MARTSPPLYREDLVSVTSKTITHSVGDYRNLAITVVDANGNALDPGDIVSVINDIVDPDNAFVITFGSAFTGTIYVFNSPLYYIGTYLAEEQRVVGGLPGQLKGATGDTTPDYLENKLVAGARITLATLNPTGDTEIEITADEPIFGQDYVFASADSRTTTTSTSFQVKLTHTTSTLTGTYFVRWSAIVDNDDKGGEFRLRETVGGTTISGPCIEYSSNSDERIHVGGMAEVVFTAESKTFEIQFRDISGGETQGIQQARLSYWRVA